MTPSQEMDVDKPEEEGSEQQDEAASQQSEEWPPSTRGYAHLAEFMTKTHHGMMRRFRDLSTLNLLYLQAELYQLKYELDRETRADMRCPRNDERSDWDFHWRLLATSGLRTDGKRWEIWLKLRERLYEYQEAINKHSKIVAMSGPTNEQRKILANIVGRDSLSQGTFAFFSPELVGVEPEVYKEDFLDDLVLLEAADEENDLLERVGVRSVLRLFRALGGCKMKLIQQEDIESGLGGTLAIIDGQVYQYPKTTYSAANRIIGAFSSAIVPMASILTLFAINSQNVRVGLVCIFALIFCLLLSLLTKARRIEIFAATAAFMSVQLVFISQNN
ncbi:hypothetical protein VM1G_10914 [Cytospora mali]|uniref:DUF6594 domain-containing protein n=1 Tax=Cytospora mali TaxID=578113 RepID=A0A194VJH0_CYTMA|nr:hypothetical protein VM1G_10914 [Valsa mali]